MASATGFTVRTLLSQHSTNQVQTTDYVTSSKKQWAAAYHPIERVNVRCGVVGDAVQADFDGAFTTLQSDDEQRMDIAGYPPNRRFWRLETEADVTNWFHHEVSNIVLAAWADQPRMIQQAETKPLTETAVPETVDLVYSTKPQSSGRVPVVIGEMKRNLLKSREWMRGEIRTAGQRELSQELRGYAHKYSCPQIFCFDGKVLLLLQFRADTAEDIASQACEVDCWVIPTLNNGGCTLRYALYRFLVQGLRRCQGNYFANPQLQLNGLSPVYREFYSGEAVWELPGTADLTKRPWGYYRMFDLQRGVFLWMRDGQPVDGEGDEAFVWDMSRLTTV